MIIIKDKKGVFVAVLLNLLYIVSASAIPAIPEPVLIEQPDGSFITVIAEGDENGYTLRTIDGEHVARNTAGYMVKGKKMEVKSPRKRLSSNRDHGYLRISDYPTIGRHKALVVLVEFQDCRFSAMEDAYSYYDGMLNEEGFSYKNGAHGSVRDYYLYSSGGKFDPEFVVVGPVLLPGNVEDYGADTDSKLDPQAWKMVRDACMQIDDKVNFSDFDADGDGKVDSIYFFYAGFGQADSLKGEVIWPHNGLLKGNWGVDLMLDGKWIDNYACSNEIRFNSAPLWLPVGIGTFVHEFGHVLGLADHYDTRYSSGRCGVEAWDTMGAASYNDNQNTPPAFSAYERSVLGWTSPLICEKDREGLLTLKALDGENMEALRIDVDGKEGKEYFMIERRSRKDWDTTLPAEGVLVWHIAEEDEIWIKNNLNVDPLCHHVDIVEADGTEDKTSYHSDVFPGTKKITAFDFMSHEGDKVFSFDHIEQDDDKSVIILGGTGFVPSSPEVMATDVHGSSFHIQWSACPDALGYKLSVMDREGNNLENLAGKVFLKPETVEVAGLKECSEYIVDLRSYAGSYGSKASPLVVSTGNLEFFEKVPANVQTDVYDKKGFSASWDNLDGATDYKVSLLTIESGEETTEEWGIDEGLTQCPKGWTIHGGKISKSFFGKKSPSLQLQEPDEGIDIKVEDAEIMEIAFYIRSQVESNILHVESYDSEGEIIEDRSVYPSASGKTETITLPEGTVSLSVRFEKSGGYLVLDDIAVRLREKLAVPLTDFTEISSFGKNYIKAEVPSGYDRDECLLTLYAVKGGERSRSTEPVSLGSLSAVAAPYASDNKELLEEMYDLNGFHLPASGVRTGFVIEKTTKGAKKRIKSMK